MPAVYRIEDSQAADIAKLDATLAAAVTFDGRKTGMITAGEYFALLVEHEIRPLPHPLEVSKLRSYGETWLSASCKGILLHIERRICLKCGHLFDSPTLTFSVVGGCILGLIAWLLLFSFLRFQWSFATGESIALAGGAAAILSGLIPALGTLLVRICFARRQAAIQVMRCPVCDSKQWKSVSSFGSERVPIGRDGRWIRVTIAGKS